MDVMSVAGPVAPDALGRVLVHEHVQISYAGERLDPLASCPLARSTWVRSSIDPSMARIIGVKALPRT